MRFKGFFRRVVGRDRPEFMAFAPEHYREAGVPVSTFSGMPVLEAFQLVNKWNSHQAEAQYLYFLEAQ